MTAESQQAAPEFVLVPREPTQAMLDAAAATPGIKHLDDMAVLTQLRDSGRSARTLDWGEGSPLEQAWAAMLAASPQAPDAHLRLAALLVPNWRPIETAPKNGTEVVLHVKMRAGVPNGCLVGHYMAGGHCIEDHPPIAAGWYFWNGCMFDKAAEPLEWMPLPAITAQAAQGKAA